MKALEFTLYFHRFPPIGLSNTFCICFPSKRLLFRCFSLFHPLDLRSNTPLSLFLDAFPVTCPSPSSCIRDIMLKFPSEAASDFQHASLGGVLRVRRCLNHGQQQGAAPRSSAMLMATAASVSVRGLRRWGGGLRSPGLTTWAEVIICNYPDY